MGWAVVEKRIPTSVLPPLEREMGCTSWLLIVMRQKSEKPCSNVGASMRSSSLRNRDPSSRSPLPSFTCGSGGRACCDCSSILACWLNPSCQICPIRSTTNVRSLVTRTVSLGSSDATETVFSCIVLSSGTRVMNSCCCRLSWLSTSKVRMLSTSSPKKSMRKGYSLEYEKTSTSEPRTANCPGS